MRRALAAAVSFAALSAPSGAQQALPRPPPSLPPPSYAPSAPDQPAASAAPTSPASWLGPEAEFRLEAGRVLGPWRHSARPLIAYFTGPHAQQHPAFIEVGQDVAARVRGRFQEVGKAELLPSAADDNGALLYPDGAPRVILLIMPGGNSGYTMADLAGVSDPLSLDAIRRERAKFQEARRLPRAAFLAGMNYVGCCGGFFTAASGYDIPGTLNTGWELWPGKVTNIGPNARRPFPDVVFDGADPRHPLVAAAPGGVLKGMYYNAGPIGVRDGAPDTEYLGKYRGGALTELDGDWFLVAYRPADNRRSGRCVIATGHPEVNHRDYLRAMALYAVDHEIETLVRPLELSVPVAGIVGDDQLHYFRFDLPRGGRITVELTGLSENCDVYLRAGLPPTPWRYDERSETAGTANERIVHSALRGGPWFIAVYGRHSALEGTRYTLTARLD